MITSDQRIVVDAVRATRFRLDVRKPGEPFLPHAFYETYDAAFDDGLQIVTGQTEHALAPRAGWDFIVRGAR